MVETAIEVLPEMLSIYALGSLYQAEYLAQAERTPERIQHSNASICNGAWFCFLAFRTRTTMSE